MGWTSKHASFYKNGKVDRKAECDSTLTWDNDNVKSEVIKSQMVGSTHYAAVKQTDKATGGVEIFAAVTLTSSDSHDYFNFSYKGMEETMGPVECDCPLSILKLLSPTDSKWALEWREKCQKKAEFKKRLNALNYGDTIRWHNGDKVHLLVKHAPAYQFKTWFWACEGGYVSKTRLNFDNVEFI